MISVNLLLILVFSTSFSRPVTANIRTIIFIKNINSLWKWPLGRITTVDPNEDDIARVVTVINNQTRDFPKTPCEVITSSIFTFGGQNFMYYSLTYSNSASYIQVCHRSDPKVSECITKSIESLKPQLKQGIPELNVPSVEPLPLNEIKLRSGPNQAKINADLSNVNVWDVALLKVTDLKPDFKNRIFLVKVNLPHLYFKGDYEVDMNILIIKYKGKGVVSGNLTDYNVDFTLKYDLIKKNENYYMHFQKMGIRIFPGKSAVHLEGLFRNDPTLGRGIDEVITDNSDLFLNEILPALEEGLSTRLTEIGNDITDTYPYHEILPE